MLISIKLFMSGFIVLSTLDLLWLGVIASKLYKNLLNPATSLSIYQICAAIGVWTLITLGAMLFVLPRTEFSTLSESFCWGSLYGLVLYGVYELTNFAALASWPPALIAIDTAWGCFLCGTLVVVLTQISRFLR